MDGQGVIRFEGGLTTITADEHRVSRGHRLRSQDHAAVELTISYELET